MKRIVSMILVVAMMAAFFCTPAFAAGSKQSLVEYVTVKNATVTRSSAPVVKKSEVTAALAALDETGKKSFEDAGLKADKVSVTVLDQKDVKVDAGKTATMDIKMDGSANVKIAALLKTADGSMKLLAVGNPPLSVELGESGTIVVVLVK